MKDAMRQKNAQLEKQLQQLTSQLAAAERQETSDDAGSKRYYNCYVRVLAFIIIHVRAHGMTSLLKCSYMYMRVLISTCVCTCTFWVLMDMCV